MQTVHPEISDCLSAVLSLLAIRDFLRRRGNFEVTFSDIIKHYIRHFCSNKTSNGRLLNLLYRNWVDLWRVRPPSKTKPSCCDWKPPIIFSVFPEILLEAILSSSALTHVWSNLFQKHYRYQIIFFWDDATEHQIVGKQENLVFKKEFKQSQTLSDNYGSRFFKKFVQEFNNWTKWQPASDNFKESNVIWLCKKYTPRRIGHISRIVKAHVSGQELAGVFDITGLVHRPAIRLKFFEIDKDPSCQTDT